MTKNNDPSDKRLIVVLFVMGIVFFAWGFVEVRTGVSSGRGGGPYFGANAAWMGWLKIAGGLGALFLGILSLRAKLL